MKKSLIALAVAGAMVAPMVAQADATLYGSFRMELNKAEDADFDLNDNATRVGIKGDVDLGLEDTKGLFHWEFAVSTVDAEGGYYGLRDDDAGELDERLAYIGAKGSWGTALVGRQYHPHFLFVNLNTYTFSDASMAEQYFLGNEFHKREDETIAYVSPNMNGLTLAAGAVIAGEGDDSGDDVNGYNIGATYSGNGLTAGFSFGKVETAALGTTDDEEVLGVSAKYAVNDALTLMARYEDRENFEGLDADVLFVAAAYKVNNTTFKLGYSDQEADDGFTKSIGGTSDLVDQDTIAAEVHQKLGKGAVYAAYSDTDVDDGESSSLFTMGYRLDF